MFDNRDNRKHCICRRGTLKVDRRSKTDIVSEFSPRTRNVEFLPQTEYIRAVLKIQLKKY